MDAGLFRITEAAIDEDTYVVAPHGEVDAATAPELGTVLAAAAARGRRRVILDLGNVSFLDSRGLKVIISADRRVTEAGGSLITVCPDPFVRRLFEVTGLGRALHVVESPHAESKDHSHRY